MEQTKQTNITALQPIRMEVDPHLWSRAKADAALRKLKLREWVHQAIEAKLKGGKRAA